MGYLLHILLAVAAQAAGESGASLAELPSVFGLVLLPVPWLLAQTLRRAAMAGHFKRAARQARALHVLAPALFACLTLGTDWVQRVRDWTGAELNLFSWPEASLAVAFAPFVLLQVVVLHAEAVAHEPGVAARRARVVFQSRMFFSSLVPLGLYVMLSASVGWVPGWKENVQEVALIHAGFMTALLTVLALSLPTILTHTWDTVPLAPGPQREILNTVGRRAGFQPRALLVWRTGHQMANAAVVGFGGRGRRVLFSDALLSMLSLRELAAVYAHEIGHVKCRHVAVFLAWALTFFLAGDLAATWIAPGDAWLETGIVVGSLVVWALCFGWYSRRCELEADLFSLELLGDPEAMMSALERVGGRSRDVAGWRHFSTAARVGFLVEAWRNPDLVQRFRRRLRRLAWLGGVLFVLLVGAQAWGLAQRFDQDRVRAELAVGHWERAVERAERIEEFDTEILEVLRAGAERQGERERLTPADLERELTTELRRADWAGGAADAELLAVLGWPGLDTVGELCAHLAAGRRVQGQTLLKDCPQRWAIHIREGLGAGEQQADPERPGSGPRSLQ